MGYYLKVSYGKKTKKYAVRDPLLISLNQIKQSLVPSVKKLHLYYQLTEPRRKGEETTILFFKSQRSLLEYLSQKQYQENCTVRLNFYNIVSQKGEEDMQFEGIETRMKQKNSKSEQVKVTSERGEYSFGTLENTQQFLFNSLNQNVQKKRKIQNLIKSAQTSLQKLKQQSRTTNVDKLLKFLNEK